eukprot:3381477-Amphidinium_carterae.1
MVSVGILAQVTNPSLKRLRGPIQAVESQVASPRSSTCDTSLFGGALGDHACDGPAWRSSQARILSLEAVRPPHLL